MQSGHTTVERFDGATNRDRRLNRDPGDLSRKAALHVLRIDAVQAVASRDQLRNKLWAVARGDKVCN